MNEMKKIKIQTLTLEQAKGLKVGTTLYHIINRNSDGSAQRWKVSGKAQTWKHCSWRVKVPIKNGLRNCSYLTEDSLYLLSLTNHSEYHFKHFPFPSQAKAFQAVKIKEGYSTHTISICSAASPSYTVYYYKLIN